MGGVTILSILTQVGLHHIDFLSPIELEAVWMEVVLLIDNTHLLVYYLVFKKG